MPRAPAAAAADGGLAFGHLLGFEGTDPGLGLLSLVFLVALGVDYGIFPMHRMRVESLTGAEPRRAALRAPRTTGGCGSVISFRNSDAFPW
ncbi:hypothetical protein Sm713_11550 [Streptomyces sp. TS71-3]|nr:hypothetical protein Sm713_11550 [Streptomyces sp. TS71-3]